MFEEILDQCFIGKGLPSVSTSGHESVKSLFTTFSKKLRAHPNVIFYESMGGYKVMDSPAAIFREITKTNAEFLHVWSVSDLKLAPPDMLEMENVRFVKRHSPQYLYWLARAGYIVGNSVFPDYFVRREDQKYLNTWHGIGYKALGRTHENPLGAALTVSNMLQATHVTSPCDFMTGIHMNGLSMRGPFSGRIAETGYPRVDTTLAQSTASIDALYDELRLDRGKRTVLYAPTWRGGDAPLNLESLERDLLALKSADVNVVFLSHHIAEKHVRGWELEGVCLPPVGMNTNAILAAADLLISDYSSIFFDYLVLDRPIIHYLYDYEDYLTSRGLTLSLDELPGTIVLNGSELTAETSRLLQGRNADESEKYEVARQRFSPHDDGEASGRVVRWFLQDNPSAVSTVEKTEYRPKLVFWGGLLKEAEATEDLIAQMQQEISTGIYDLTLVVGRPSKSNLPLMDFLRTNGGNISVVTRDSYEMGMTQEEKRARRTLNSESLPETRELYYDIYRREYRRLLGDSRFDTIIFAKNLTRFWVELSKYALK